MPIQSKFSLLNRGALAVQIFRVAQRSQLTKQQFQWEAELCFLQIPKDSDPRQMALPLEAKTLGGDSLERMQQ
jgi:hypothetical protein